MGLKLTGTLVGRHSRSATISRKRYAEGATVTATPNERRAPAGEHALVLKQVGPRHAILEIDGVQFRLELDPAQAPGNGITVVRRQSSLSN